MIALVARGLGAAVIPSIVAIHEPGLRAIRIDRPRLVRTIGLARAARGGFGPASAGAFAAEPFALLHEAGWPGVRPSGLHLPASGTTISPWPAPPSPPVGRSADIQLQQRLGPKRAPAAPTNRREQV